MPLLLDQGQKGAGRCLLAAQKLLVQAGSLLLQRLQGLHGLLGQAQGILQRCRSRSRDYRCSGCGRGQRWRRDDRRGRCQRLRCPGRTFRRWIEIVGAAQGDNHPLLFRHLGPFLGIISIPAAEIDAIAEDRQLAEGAGEIVNCRTMSAGGVEGEGLMLATGENRLDHAGQPRAGADLDKGAETAGIKALDLVDKFDRTGELGGEELAGTLGARRVSLTAAVGKDRGLAGLEFRSRQGRNKRSAGGGDERTVKGSGDGQLLVTETASLKQFCRLGNLCSRPGKDALLRGIAIGKDQIEAFLDQQLFDFRDGGGDSEHRAAIALTGGHEFAAAAGKAMESAFSEVTTGTEGSQLAVTVAGKGIGRQGKGVQHLEGAETDGTEGRLGHFGGLQPRDVGLTAGIIETAARIDRFGEATAGADRISKRLIGGLDRGEVCGELQRQLGEHPGILRSLTGKEDGELAGSSAAGKVDAIRSLPGRLSPRLRQHTQGALDLGRGIALPFFHHQRQATPLLRVELLAARMRGETELRPRGFGREGAQEGFQSRAIAGAEGGNLHLAAFVDDDFLRRVLFEKTVKVAAAETEGTDPGTAWVGRMGDPGTGLRVEIEGTALGNDDVLGFLHLEGRRQDFVVQGEGCLDQPRRTGGGLGVADLRFDRAEGAPGALGFTEDLAQGLDLDGVTDLGAGAVRFDQFDRLRGDIPLLIGTTQRLLLPGGTRFVDCRAAAVAGGADTTDDGINAVTIAFGVGKAFENDNPETFTEGGAVTVRRERLGMSGGREGRRLAEAGVHEDIVEGIDTAGNDHVGLAGTEFEGGEVEGGEGAAAGGIDNAVGAAEVEVLADAAGDNVAEEAGEGVLLPGDVGIADARDGIGGDVVGDAGFPEGGPPARMAEPGAQGDDELQAAGDTEDDADLLAIKLLVGAVAGVNQRLFDGDQTEELGSIDRFQGVGEDAVLHGMKIDRREETAHLGVDLIRGFRVGIEIVLRAPVTGRNFGDGIPARADITPESDLVLGLRKDAADTDDGDRCRRLPGLFYALFQWRYSLICAISNGSESLSAAAR